MSIIDLGKAQFESSCTFTIDMGTVAIPIVYLYAVQRESKCFGSDFLSRSCQPVNKHGLLFVWVVTYEIITSAMGYMFMVPYS